MSFRQWITLAIAAGAILAVIFFTPWIVDAQEVRTFPVTLAWEPNTEGDLAGYWVYDQGAKVAEVPAGTETVDLSVGIGDHEWHVTALDWSANESEESNKVFRSFDEVPPQEPAGTTIINLPWTSTTIINIGEQP